MTAVVLALTAAGFLFAPSGRAAFDERAYGTLADSIESVVSDGTLQSHLGILALSLDRGDTLLALRPARRFIPASNMKLFVTGAFLKQLGPGARGTTEISARGKVKRGHGGREIELQGDLALRGSGFPDVYQLLRPGARGLLDSLAFLLHAAGLRKFEGTLRVDGSLFAPEPFGPGWAIDDIPYSYGAPLNAILANGNAASLVASAAGDEVTLALDPAETPLRIEGRVAVVDSGSPGRLSIARDPGSRILRVAGQLPRGGIIRRQVAVPDPDSTAGLVLLGAMARAGIKVKARVEAGAAGVPGTAGAPGAAAAPGAAPAGTGSGFDAVGSREHAVVVRLDSPTAGEIVSMVEPYSLNVETEALLRHLDPAPAGKSAGPALRRLAATLAGAGIDTLDLSFVDGSGLSPLNLASPRAIVRWLEAMDGDPALATVFRETLASPGGVGTLRNRLATLDRAAALRAKTGTLTNVSALSGYLVSADGERIAFSILSNANRGSVAAAREAEEAIVGMLARFRRVRADAERTPWMIPR